jgi:site-specific DNA-adenine methylase
MIRVPHCRDIYEAALRVLHQPIADPIKSAAAFLVAAQQGKCIGHPCLKHRGDWWTYINTNAHIKLWMSLPDALLAMRQRFVAVQIEQRSWYATIKEHASPTTLLFVDPPFFPGTVARYYPVEMTVNEHRAMLAVLKQVPGFVVLCGYDNVVYRRELRKWKEISTQREWQRREPDTLGLTTIRLRRCCGRRKQVQIIATSEPHPRQRRGWGFFSACKSGVRWF